MVDVTKKEAAIIREQLPNVYVGRTKHKWHVAETRSVVNLLRTLRGEKPRRRKNGGRRYDIREDAKRDRR